MLNSYIPVFLAFARFLPNGIAGLKCPRGLKPAPRGNNIGAIWPSMPARENPPIPDS